MSAECRPPEGTPDGTVFTLERKSAFYHVKRDFRWRKEKWTRAFMGSFTPAEMGKDGWRIAEPPHE